MTSVLLMVGLVAAFCLFVVGGTMFIASGDSEAQDLHGYPEAPSPSWGEADNRSGTVALARPVVLPYEINTGASLIAEHRGDPTFLPADAASTFTGASGKWHLCTSMERQSTVLSPRKPRSTVSGQQTTTDG